MLFKTHLLFKCLAFPRKRPRFPSRPESTDPIKPGGESESPGEKCNLLAWTEAVISKEHKGDYTWGSQFHQVPIFYFTELKESRGSQDS